MARRAQGLWFLLVGSTVAAAGAAAFALTRSRELRLAPAAPGSAASSRPIGPPPITIAHSTHAAPTEDDAEDDETALARMLASEVGENDPNSLGARAVIGWITIQVARRRKRPIFDVVTAGHGYGVQKEPGIKRYASTQKPPTAKTRELAKQLLAGELLPSAVIRGKKPGAWVERDQGVSDASILRLQNTFDEGIWARVDGTKWMLYSPAAPKIDIESPLNPGARLDDVPTVAAIDRGVA